MRVSGCQHAEIYMVVVGNKGRGRPRKRWMEVVDDDDLTQWSIDRGLAIDRDRWGAQILRKSSDLCEHGQRA